MIIGVGGVSRSGKTTFAKELQVHYQHKGKSVRLLSQDNYVIAEELIPKVQDRVDWELPQTIDLSRLLKTIEANQADVLIIEGLFAFAFEVLNKRYDLKIFLKIGKEIFLYRKSIDRRYNEPQWFIEHIWKSYLKYGSIDETDKIYNILNGEEAIGINQKEPFLS